MDRLIVTRFNPAGALLPPEYLRRTEALFAEDEWVWSGERELAHVFESHGDAQTVAAKNRYQDAAGHWHSPFCVVLETPGPAALEFPTPRDRSRHVSPEESFANLERRRLA